MTERWIRAGAAWTLCAALVLASGCAGLKATDDKGSRSGERPRVVVLDVEGKKSAAVRNKLVSLLQDRYEVVPRRQYQRAAKRLRARTLQAADVAEVAAELELAAVVHGYLERDGKRRYQLAVIVREGASGAVVDELGVSLRTRRLAGKERRKLGKQLVASVSELASERPIGPRESRLDTLAEINEREREEARARRADARERETEAAAEADERRDRKREARAAREREAEERQERRQQLRAAEQRAAEERAERRRQARAERERDADRTEDSDEDDEPAPKVEIRRDQSGQAIDDEMPDVLR